MKRLCVFCIALFVLMSVPVMATETRVMTMGDQYLFIQDDYNIWHFTSTVNNYPRHLIVDHDEDPADSRVGMIVPFIRNSVIGAFFSGYTESIDFAPISADQRLDLFYGYRATNFDLGFHVSWWGDKVEETGVQSSTAMGLDAGIGFNANGNMLELDAFYYNLDFTDEPLAGGTPNSERDAGSDLGFMGRYLWAYNNMTTLVPALSVEQYKVRRVGDLAEVKWTGFDLGLGCNTVPLQGTEFLTSVGIMVNKYEVSDTAGTIFDDNWKDIPYVKFGADIQLKSWLNMRVGATKFIVTTYEDKAATPSHKETSSDFDYHVGAGIMVGDVQFDVEVQREWLQDGPNFLSGEADGDMFGLISFKYDFR